MKSFILTLFFSLFCFSLFAQDTTKLVQYSLNSFQDSSHQYLVLSLKNEKGWHTYWKNPGDAGTPTETHFFHKGKEVPFEALEWMAPHRYFEAGDLLAFGYEGTTHYFFRLSPAQVKNLNNQTMKMEAKWLVCKDICIPGKGEIDFTLSNGNITKKQGETGLVSNAEIKSAFASLPTKLSLPQDLNMTLTVHGDKKVMVVFYEYPIAKNNISLSNNFLTAFPTKPFGFKREELFYDAKNQKVKGLLSIDWEGEYQDPEMPLPKVGKLPKPLTMTFLWNQSGKVAVIEKSFDQLLHYKSMASFTQGLEKIIPEGSAEKKTPTLTTEEPLSKPANLKEESLLYFLFLAFLGGLILNLMPCVLPVISLKLYSLLKQQAESDNRILKHNLSYTAGILACFLALAGVVISIKKTGEDIGWGFQLQSPTFLILMILLIFVFCLNLFGLFEFITPGGKTIGNKQVKDGFVGDFFSGVFATILSTPCSAPFLGTALTFAFTTSNMNIVLIFGMIGIGLAFPFLLTGFFPHLTHIMPKPGMWMEHMKRFLGFALLLTAIWLYDVLLSNNPPPSVITFVNVSLSFIFFGLYLRKVLPKNKLLSSTVLLISVLSLAFTVKSSMTFNNPTTTTDYAGWQAFSEEKLSSIKDQDVFVDFTAEWCFTCKVNEKLLLNTDRFQKFAREKNIVLMKGDWTKRDDEITQFLKRYNVFGVPAYFIKKKSGEIVFLGELVTIDKISKHLN